jgi:hypothetical protein
VNGVLIFNHHSLPFQSIDSADDFIPEFLKICIKCKNVGLSTILLDFSIDPSWFRLELFKGYFWQDWYNRYNDEINRDLCRAFRSIQTSQPFFSMDDINNNTDLFEVEFQGSTQYEALRVACWNEAPITSFPTALIWKDSPLKVSIHKLNQNGDLDEEPAKIYNFYSLTVYEAIESALLSERNDLLKKATDIYNQWDVLFPYLKYCGKVQEQFMHWSHKDSILSQVVESLTILNAFSQKWEDGIFDYYSHENLKETGLNHRASGESESVKNDASLRKQREFYLPDGVKRFFENHIKLNNGYRIHFYPDSDSKTLFIGYIGKHLKL